MRRTFRTVNQVISALMVIFGIVMLVISRNDSGAQTGISFALGIVLIVYGVTRFLLYSRFGRPDR